MFEILDRSLPPRQLPSRLLHLVRARCLHCGHEQVMAEQNAQKANRNPDSRCKKCHENTFHYMTKTRFYRIWFHMKFRATDPRSPDHHRYGPHTGRGMCETWKSFDTFYRDMFPTYAEDRTLERIDNSKGYSKNNCRWATNMEQQANKVNNRVVRYQGEDMHLAEFCRRAGVTRAAITRHLNAGLNGDEAVAAHLACPYPKIRKSRKRKV
jgi:hypothetical protein